jgi:uncharacterized glyoxalase superfamily protein PhnB
MAQSAQNVFPMLSYEDGIAALEWLTRVFGFREVPGSRVIMPDGVLGHAQMETGGGLIMLATATEGYESPKHHREHCERARRWSQSRNAFNGVLVNVSDAGQHYERAKREGATLLTELQDGFPGLRYRAEDLEGLRWMFLQPA